MKIQFDNGIKVEVDDNATDADIEEIYNSLSSSATSQPQAQNQELSMLDRLQQRNYERVSRVFNQPSNATPIIDPLISAVRVPFGAIADIPTEIASTAYKALPEGIKTTISEAIPEPVKKAVSFVGKKASEFTEQHPTISNVAGLALDLPTGTGTALLGKAGLKKSAKGVAKVGKGIENLGDETVNLAKKGEALNGAIKGRARRRFLEELVTEADALKDPKRKVLIDKYKTKVAIPNKDEVIAAKALYNIKEIKPNILKEEVKGIINKQIPKKGNELRNELSRYTYKEKIGEILIKGKSGKIITSVKAEIPIKDQVKRDIISAKSKLFKEASLLDSESKKAFDRVFDTFSKILDEKDSNIVSIWEARSELDSLVKREIGDKAFDTSSGISGLKRANFLIRDTINEFVDKNIPNKLYKKKLNELSGLYTARDNIAEKAAKLEKATWGERKFEGVKKAITLRNMVTTGAILSGVGTSTLGAGVAPTLLLAGTGYAGYKGFKAAKALTPAVEKQVGKALQKTGKGLQSSVNKLLP
jgi:hypothetical protein